MINTDTVAAGAVAWSRIREEHGRRCFDDWMTVAGALAIGRTEALKAAKRNRPVGTTYNRLMGQWLKQHGLDGISTQERYRALLCHENLAAISAWRNDLDEAQRRTQNHPNLVWQAWRRKAATPAPTRQHVISDKSHKRGCARAIHLSQDMLRRAATAIREAHSNDCIVLARKCLEAAIRNELDLLELLPDSPPKPACPPRGPLGGI